MQRQWHHRRHRHHHHPANPRAAELWGRWSGVGGAPCPPPCCCQPPPRPPPPLMPPCWESTPCCQWQPPAALTPPPPPPPYARQMMRGAAPPLPLQIWAKFCCSRPPQPHPGARWKACLGGRAAAASRPRRHQRPPHPPRCRCQLPPPHAGGCHCCSLPLRRCRHPLHHHHPHCCCWQQQQHRQPSPHQTPQPPFQQRRSTL
jgi:hypothetical protein